MIWYKEGYYGAFGEDSDEHSLKGFFTRIWLPKSCIFKDNWV